MPDTTTAIKYQVRANGQPDLSAIAGCGECVREWMPAARENVAFYTVDADDQEAWDETLNDCADVISYGVC